MTLGLTKLTDRFRAGEMSKQEFIDAINHCHATWFEYADYLAGSDVASIEILPGRVMLTSSAGVRFLVDPLDKRQQIVEALHFRHYEKFDASMLYALTPHTGVAFDIGANRGWYSLHLAKRFPGLQVHAFEPIPIIATALGVNLGLNQIQNVTIHNFGLSSKPSNTRFFFHSNFTSASSAANILGLADSEEIEVTLRTLDEVQEEWDSAINLIKCDVEGGELFIFQGGIKALERCKPVIFCEMLRKWSAKFLYHPNNIISLLASVGYRCYTVENGGLVLISEVDEETMATNFFFLHHVTHRNLLNTRI